jgi:uncharacterized membrane protein
LVEKWALGLHYHSTSAPYPYHQHYIISWLRVSLNKTLTFNKTLTRERMLVHRKDRLSYDSLPVSGFLLFWHNILVWVLFCIHSSILGTYHCRS